MYDVVVIGSGLGGLQCGCLLSKQGLKVCVLEKNDRIGGMIQSFVRDGVVFNTGLNYTESLGEGEVLYRYFKLFGLIGKITLKQLDKNQSDIITLGDHSYSIPQGYQNYTDALKNHFPDEAKGIESYLNGLKDVCYSFPFYKLSKNNKDLVMDMPDNSVSASQFINKSVTNKNLKGVLAGTNILYAGQQDVTPLYIHALINYSFIKSSWRIKEGGSGVANVLAQSIKSNGGVIFRNARVAKIRANNGTVSHLELSNGEKVFAKNFISSVHPKIIIPMIDQGGLKKIFRSRILSLKDSIGMFSVYIVLKKNSLKYQNYNHHYFKSNQVWTTDNKDWPQNFLMYTQFNHKTTEYADGLTIVAYMNYSEVAQWSNTYVEKRGADYETFKKRKAEKLIALAEIKIPHLSQKVASYYTSTPLTYRDYTGSFNGSAYGVVKDYQNPSHSIIAPRTRLKNFFFTGQNLNMHGILGVSIASALTCSQFLGTEFIYNKLIVD